MPDVPIRLAAAWTALMLTYLLGDVLRIFAGDFEAGEIGGVKANQAVWMAAALIMLVPIAMLIVSVTFDGQVACVYCRGRTPGLQPALVCRPTPACTTSFSLGSDCSLMC